MLDINGHHPLLSHIITGGINEPVRYPRGQSIVELAWLFNSSDGNHHSPVLMHQFRAVPDQFSIEEGKLDLRNLRESSGWENVCSSNNVGQMVAYIPLLGKFHMENAKMEEKQKTKKIILLCKNRAKEGINMHCKLEQHITVITMMGF